MQTGAGSACHCAVHQSGKWVAVAHHGLPPGYTDGVSGAVAIVKLAQDGTPLERVAFVVHPTETDSELLSDPRRADWTTHAHSANFDTTGKWLFVCEVRYHTHPVHRVTEPESTRVGCSHNVALRKDLIGSSCISLIPTRGPSQITLSA